MTVLPMTKIENKIPERIGKLIPEGKLTVLSGLSGTGKGKSYSLIKFLNGQEIQPILFNMGNDLELERLDLAASSNDHNELTSLITNQYTNIRNSVIVIDHYDHCKDIFGIITPDSQEYFVSQLQTLCTTQNCTIIIVTDGQLSDTSSTGIFNDNLPLVRECFEHLHASTETAGTLFVNKGEGIGGFKTINNWMTT